MALDGTSIPMEYRDASSADTELLARLNLQLIRDEGHRNPMTLAQLQVRMDNWLQGEYQAVLFEHDGETVGYALFRGDTEYIYLRQFFVTAQHRRKGLGRQGIKWLSTHHWKDAPGVRVEVLVGTEEAIAFWRAIGFVDYCLTLERHIEDS